MRYLTVSILVFGGIMMLPSAPAEADVSAECWAHLAGVQTAKTPAADRRFHLARGEYSPCTEYDAQEGTKQGSQSNSEQRNQDSGSSYRPKDNSAQDGSKDRKSRHCRKHWYC